MPAPERDPDWPQGGYFELQGAVNRNGKPFVLTSIDGEPFGQLTPAEAINHGVRAIQAGIEAERDAATFAAMTKFARDPADSDEEAARFAAGVIAAIRDHRGQVDPDPRNDHPTPPTGV